MIELGVIITLFIIRCLFMIKLETETQAAIASHLLVMLGALAVISGAKPANGSWEVVAAGFCLMIAGIIVIWSMYDAQKKRWYRPPQNNKTINKLDA